MLKLIFNKDDSFFWKKKLTSSLGGPQENDAKFRFAINPQGIWQFHDNCKIASLGEQHYKRISEKNPFISNF